MRAAAALLIFPLAFLVASIASARPVEVTTCGQRVVGRGVLVADLDCSGSPSVAVELEKARLDLNGHTIIGGGTNVAVHCLDPKCRVVGPGTITGGGSGILGRGRLTVKNVTLTGLFQGVTTILYAGKGGATTLQGCTLTDDDIGVTAETRVKLIDTVISGTHRFGVNAGSAEFNNTSCTALPVFVKRSSVTGLADDPMCGSTVNCTDVVTCEKPPRLDASTCGTSCKGATGVPCASWGVCTND